MEPLSSSQNVPAPQAPNSLAAQAAFPEAGTLQPSLPAAFQVPFSPPLDPRVAARLKEIDPTVALVSLRHAQSGRIVNQEPLMFFAFNFPQEVAEKLKQSGMVYVSVDGRDGKSPIQFCVVAPQPASVAAMTPEQQQLADLREEMAKDRRQREHERALAMLRGPVGSGAAPAAAAVDPVAALNPLLGLLKGIVEIARGMIPPQAAAVVQQNPADQIKPLMEGMGAMMTGFAKVGEQARAISTPVETKAQEIAAYANAISQVAPVVVPLIRPSAPPATQPNPTASSPFKDVA